MEEKFFDENDAVRFIRAHAGEEIAGKYSSNDLLLLLDTMFDYYDSHDVNDDLDTEIELVSTWVTKELRKDKENKIEPQDVPAIVAAEIAYEETLSL